MKLRCAVYRFGSRFGRCGIHSGHITVDRTSLAVIMCLSDEQGRRVEISLAHAATVSGPAGHVKIVMRLETLRELRVSLLPDSCFDDKSTCIVWFDFDLRLTGRGLYKTRNEDYYMTVI